MKWNLEYNYAVIFSKGHQDIKISDSNIHTRQPAVICSFHDFKHSGTRQICWITPSGLVFEHTGLYFGRITEKKLVELWGTRADSREGNWKIE